MITYKQLSRDGKAFKSLTGLTVAEFDALYDEFEAAWQQAEIKRLSRADRQRAIGGGAEYSHDLATRLVMVMLWLRLYLTLDAVGYFFSVNKSTVSRNGRRMITVLRQVSDGEFAWPEPPSPGQGKTLDQALAAYPDLFAIVDATEQPVQRPQQDQKQRVHYSGKKKRHTVKTTIVVNEDGLIRAVTASTPGSLHDIKHLRISGVLDCIPIEVGVIADSGYDGLYKNLPHHSVATAHKARRNHPLTDNEKQSNRELSRVRIVVENVLCHIKHFQAMAQRFRHPLHIYDDIFRTIAAIVNRRTRSRLASLNA